MLLISGVYYYCQTRDYEAMGWQYNRIDKYHTNKDNVLLNKESNLETYDFIVVGSGSAGAVVASRLSENPDVSVLLIEAGGADSDFRLGVPSGFTKLFQTHMDWGYESEPQKRISDSVIYSPRGKVFGGSSSTNSMIYMRGSAHDYDGWEKLGFKGWGWKDVLPYFTKSERNLVRPDSKYHNTSGLWQIADHDDIPESQKIMREALSEELNIPYKDDMNGEDFQTEGVAYNQFNMIDGKRFSVTDAFLNNEILTRPNLYIKLNTHVVRVLIAEENGVKKAIGVEVSQVIESAMSATNPEGRVLSKIYCNKEVILSAGAINSPQILMLSGVGEREELERHNIKVVHDLPEVGKNLQDHVATYVAWETKDVYDSMHVIENRPWMTVKSLYQYYFKKRSGLLRALGKSVNAVVKSETAKQNGEEAPDIQILAELNVPPYSPREKLSSFDHMNGAFACIVDLLSPKSRGQISLKSSSYLQQPKIEYNIFENKEDEDRIVDGWKKAASIANNEKFKSIITKRIHVEDYKDDEDLKKQLHRRYFNLFHPTSTLAMGKAVDERLRVYGIEGLRIADASIMPLITRANTNAPVVMIGEKASDLIKEDNLI